MWRKNEGRKPTGNVVRVRLRDGTEMVPRQIYRWWFADAQGTATAACDIVEYDDGQEPEGQGNDFSNCQHSPSRHLYRSEPVEIMHQPILQTRFVPPASPELPTEQPVRAFEDTFSAVSVIKKMFPGAFPTDAKVRKSIPVYSGVFKYFPRALLAVAELSRIGNDQHNPGEPLHWAREKSGDELDALGRHLLEAGTIDTDGVRHSTKIAWRALANLEKELEAAQ